MDLRAVTGQLYLIGGEQVDEAAPGLLALSPPGRAERGRQHDYLFIHLTLSGPAEETAELAQDLLDSISSRFFRTPGSVTAALRKAIVETNELLLRRNLSGSDAAREGALICAVQRDSELFMAQVGEAFTVLGHDFGVERLPATPPAHVTPLGRTAGLDIRFYHNWIEAGDMLLLADPRMAHLPVDSMRSALVDSDVQFGLETLFYQLEGITARLLLVEFTEDVHTGFATDPGYPTRTGERLPPPISQPKRERSPSAPRGSTIALPEIDVGDRARKATSQAAMGLGKAAGGVADVMTRIRPETDPPEQQGSLTMLALTAVLIPIIVAVVVTSVFLQRGQSQQLDTIKEEMVTSLMNAQLAGNDQDARAYYNYMLQLAEEVDKLRQSDADVTRMRLDALEGLDRLEDISRLEARVLFTYPQEALLTNVAIQPGTDGGIYTLDRANSQVWRHDTSEDYLTLEGGSPRAVLSGGQGVSNHTVGTVLDMEWRPIGTSNDRAGIAMLDSLGALITYDPLRNDNRQAPLGLASQWQRPVAMTLFNERLYVLDAGQPALWRYLPEGEGFDIREGQEQVSFTDPAALEGAVDVAIYSEDGSIILVYGDGRVRRIVSGRVMWDESDLLTGGLPSPLVQPTAVKISGTGLNSSIFIADPGAGRIVQISLGGVFLAQFRASDSAGIEQFGDIQDFDVADNPLRIFAVSGNELLVAEEQ